MRKAWLPIGLALILSAVYWLADSLFVCYGFGVHSGALEVRGRFGDSFLLHIPPHALFARTAFFVTALLGGLAISLTIRRQLRSESARKDVEIRMQSALSSAKMGTWWRDYHNDTIRLDERSATLLKYPPQAIQKEFQWWVDRVYPNDIERLQLAWKEHQQGKTDQYSMELRVRMKNGRYRWILERGMITKRDEAGHPLQAAGTHMDITERKMAETERRKLTRQVRYILDSISDGFFVLDREMRFTYFNRASEQILNRKSEEIIGHRFHKAFPEAHGSIFEQQFVKALRSQNPVSFETYFDVEPYINWYDVRVYPQSDGISVYFQVITERKTSEDALRKNEEKYRLLAENMADCVWQLTLNRRYSYVNEAVTGILGFTPDEFMQTSVSDRLSVEANELVESLIAAKIQNRDDSPETFETPIRHKDGHWVYVEITGRLVLNEEGAPDRFQGTFRDITKRRQAEAALRESEERFRALFDVTPNCILVLNRHLDCLYANRAAREYCSFTDDVSEQNNLRDILAKHPQWCETWVQRIATVFQNGHLMRFEDQQTFGETPVYSESVLTPIHNDAGDLIAVGLLYNDVTERKQAEQQRHQLEIQIQHAQKLESLGVLAGGIAHDFNNLLMGILGNADLARNDLSLQSSAHRSVLEIEKAAHRAADLCKQMLAYSGKGRFLISVINLSEIVDEMAHILKVSISKKVHMNFQFAEHLPAIEVDVTQIRQVIMNLITNASEAIGDANGTITIRTYSLHCDADYLKETYLNQDLPAGKYVCLDVTDSGCGMDDETCKCLFDPFFTTKFTGRGLGLAAVLGIVRGHQGAIKVFSQPGEGTTFKVLFPASEQSAQPVLPQTSSRDDWQGNGTILLVDDEEAIRNVARRMLEKFGFSVLVACDGMEAIQIYQHHDGDIAGVLLDLTMPNMDGEETFRELVRLNPAVRVIITSGYNEQEVFQRFNGQSLAGFIQKPFQLDSLISILRNALTTPATD